MIQDIIDDDPTTRVAAIHQRLDQFLRPCWRSLTPKSLDTATDRAVYHLLPLTRGEITRFARHPTSLEETLLPGATPAFSIAKLDIRRLAPLVCHHLSRTGRTHHQQRWRSCWTFQRFVELCAGRTASSCSTIRHWPDLRQRNRVPKPGSAYWRPVFIVFRLQAFHANVRKRLVKMPKLYFYDTGLVCWLLGIRQPEQLRSHPLRGAIFETWVVSETMKHRTKMGMAGGLWFYRDPTGPKSILPLSNRRASCWSKPSPPQPHRRTYSPAPNCVHRHFGRTCLVHTEIAVVYGGDEYSRALGLRLIPWRMLRAASLPNLDHVISVFADSRPIAGASVLGLFPNSYLERREHRRKRRYRTRPASSIHLPMTVFVAVEESFPCACRA